MSKLKRTWNLYSKAFEKSKATAERFRTSNRYLLSKSWTIIVRLKKGLNDKISRNRLTPFWRLQERRWPEIRIPNVWNPFYENHRHRRHIVIVSLKQQVENDDTNDGLPLLSDIPENRLCRILNQRYLRPTLDFLRQTRIDGEDICL
jgi:hypothetical protein